MEPFTHDVAHAVLGHVLTGLDEQAGVGASATPCSGTSRGSGPGIVMMPGPMTTR